MIRFSFQKSYLWSPEGPAGAPPSGGGTPASQTPPLPSGTGGASGASSPTPQAPQAPATPAPSKAEPGLRDDPEASASDAFNTSDFFLHDGDTNFPQEEAPPVAVPAQTPAPGVEVKPPVGAEPAVPATPAAPAVEPAAPGPTQKPQLSVSDPGSIAQALISQEGPAIDHLAETMFKLSAAEVEALESDAVGTIPKLMARAVVKAQINMLSSLAAMVPAMIQQSVSQMQTNSQNLRSFYQKFPQLKVAEHGPIVERVARSYRQMNPGVSREQMMEDVGAMVLTLAKIPATVPGTVTPASPFRANGNPPQPSPFVPASAGVAAAPAAKVEEPWGFLDPTMGSDE